MWRDPIVEEVRAIRAAIAKNTGTTSRRLLVRHGAKRVPMAAGSSTSAQRLVEETHTKGRVEKTAQHAMEPTRPGTSRRAAHVPVRV